MKTDKHHQSPKAVWLAARLPILAIALKPLLQGRAAAAVAMISGLLLLLGVIYLASSRSRRKQDDKLIAHVE